MRFTDAVKTCLSKYADFSGCASRSEYWWFVLFTVLAAFVTVLIAPLLYFIFMLGILLPALAALARRFHDGGYSAWWILIAFVPVIGGLIQLYMAVQPSKLENNPYL
jgi:uncharacterized membrane protein YhaH (DUF805 family)